jgi:DNA-directed RNA polymerase subunit RPC12/RpoP
MLYPCQQCGGLALPNAACPHCGYRAIDHGQAIIAWLSAMTPEQRGGAIAAEPAANWPATLVRAYPGANLQDASARFSWEAGLFAEAGYQPVGQSWSSGGASIGDFAAFGALAAMKSGLGYLTVTYARGVPAPAAPPATKRCPDCAEEVLAGLRAALCHSLRVGLAGDRSRTTRGVSRIVER